jgi:uncharacterized protein (DUF58 family)
VAVTRTQAASTAGGRGLIDPVALMKIRSLELRARIVVEGFLRGLHRSPYHGFSVEFTEYRAYAPGDDIRFVDWRLYARTDRHYIKKFEDETNLRCHLLVDHSRSMAYGSRGHTKATYAATLAATLAQFLFGQGDAVGVVTFADRLGEYLPARNRPGHLRRLFLTLERAPEGQATNLDKPIAAVAGLLRRRGMVVLVSDLLAPLAQLDRHLGALRAFGHEVVVFQILDPAELTFSFEAPALFRDLESGRNLFIDPGTVRARYQAGLTAHMDAIRGFCRRLGIAHHLVPTDQPIESALLAFLGERGRKGGKGMRGAR